MGEWEDLLGTGAVMKKLLVPGSRSYNDDDINMEAPRKFFALIDIETKYKDKIINSESHTNYLISSDADLFPGAHLVIPLMDVGETSQYVFESRFGYGSEGSPPDIPGGAKLECTISLKLRSPHEEFLEQLTAAERIQIAIRKRDRGKFWFQRENYQNAIAVYQSLTEICQIDRSNDRDDNIEQECDT